MTQASTVFKTLDLPGGTLMPFPAAPGERVRVLYGRVWLTEEGDACDAFLSRGEEAVLGGHGLAVTEALTPARVQILESKSLWERLSGARTVQWLADVWQKPGRLPRPACAADRKLAQTLAQFDGRLGLVECVKVQAGYAGRDQALA